MKRLFFFAAAFIAAFIVGANVGQLIGNPSYSASWWKAGAFTVMFVFWVVLGTMEARANDR